MTIRTIEEIKANPFIGDIILKCPPGTPLHEITEFEVWNGWRWVPAEEAAITIYAAEK